MGAGKTTYGKAATRKLGWAFCDLDDVISDLSGHTIPSLFARGGEAHFREWERKALDHQSTPRSHPLLIACGGGTPCFGDNMSMMNQRGTTIYLQTPAPILSGRLKHEKAHRPLIREVPEERLTAFIQELLDHREPYYLQAHHILQGKEASSQGLVNLLSTL